MIPQTLAQRALPLLGLFALILASTLSYKFFLNKNRAGSVKSGRIEKEEKISVFAPLLKPLAFKPKSISIEKINLKEVPIVEVGVEEDGRLEVPKNYNEVGWYRNGPRAGEEGNAILAGHYDRVGGTPAVFYNLVKLTIGDKVKIVDEFKKVHTFEIYEVSFVNVGDPSAVVKAYEQTNDPVLTIITCGGVWNVSSKDYSKRLLIKAKTAIGSNT